MLILIKEVGSLAAGLQEKPIVLLGKVFRFLRLFRFLDFYDLVYKGDRTQNY